MGLFDFIKGQFIDVIEWVDYRSDVLSWKFPDQDKEIKMGAQLTVRDSQAAILLNEGKMADVFEPGRFELTTRNMPIMTTLLLRVSGVALLEQTLQETRPGYKEYVETTSAFIPWPPRKP